MTPSEAIGTLDNMLGVLTKRMAGLRAECEQIEEEWEGLGMAGGQRDDHAASLLARLRPHLDDIGEFGKTVREEIDDMVADPFCRTS